MMLAPSKMTDEQLVSLINSGFENCLGQPGGEIGDERAKAWNYYLSKPIGNELEGQSKVVTADVAEVAKSPQAVHNSRQSVELRPYGEGGH
jgi:hypothetical protein